MTMNRQEVKDILASIKFLNFKFVLLDKLSHDILRIEIDAPDTRDRTTRIKVLHDMAIDIRSIYDANHLIAEVFDMVIRCLRHEAAELFSVNGILPFDEHYAPEQNNKQQELINKMFQREDKPIGNWASNQYKQFDKGSFKKYIDKFTNEDKITMHQVLFQSFDYKLRNKIIEAMVN